MDKPGVIDKLKRPLLFKFSILIITSIITVVLILTCTTIVRERKFLTVSAKERGITLVKMVALSCGNALIANDFSFMADTIKQISKEKGIVYAMIMGSDNECRVAVDPKLEGKRLEDPVSLKATQATTESPVVQRYYNSDLQEEVFDVSFPFAGVGGLRRGLGYRNRIPDADTIWGFVRLGISLKELKSRSRQTYIRGIFMAAEVILLGFLVSFYLARNITKPINQLMEGAIAVSKGDLKYQISVRTEDEIGKLAGVFNKMTKDLKESRDEIEEYSRTLEDKVEERTKELKEAQAQLIQSEKMATIGVLAGGVAHEINTPLGAILLNTEMLMKEIEEGAADKDKLENIKESTSRCKKIVEMLLNYSRKSGVVLEELDLNQVIDKTCDFLEHQLSNDKISVIKQLEKIEPIKGDFTKLMQVFTNLIVNAKEAIKSVKESGIITIKSYQDDGFAVVQVEDDGAGISEEDIEKIFDPFFTTKGVGKGTGLGLSIICRIIENHQGHITVSSRPQKGTTFTVNIPVKKMEA